MVRSLELVVEVQEMDGEGRYLAVEVREEGDGCGGVLQLRQGQQRRLVVRLKTVPNSGSLPITIEFVSGVFIGSICLRSKLQRPLDSNQEDDLVRWGFREQMPNIE